MSADAQNPGIIGFRRTAATEAFLFRSLDHDIKAVKGSLSYSETELENFKKVGN